MSSNTAGQRITGFVPACLLCRPFQRVRGRWLTHLLWEQKTHSSILWYPTPEGVEMDSAKPPGGAAGRWCS